MQWYYRADGTECGPISEFDLHKKAKQGFIKPDDLVWQKSFGKEWKPASEVPGLIDAPKNTEQSKLKMVSRPRATLRKQMKTFKVLMADGSPVSVLAARMKRFSRGKVFKEGKKQRIKSNVYPILILLSLLLVLTYYLHVHESGGVAKLFMGVGSKIGVDMTTPAVYARALSFGTALVTLRKKTPGKAREQLMGFIGPYPGRDKYINQLWEEYGKMTPEEHVVSALIQEADCSAENQRAIVIIKLSISTDGYRTDRPIRTEWTTMGNNWVCMPN
jgi:hypothetical protein